MALPVGSILQIADLKDSGPPPHSTDAVNLSTVDWSILASFASPSALPFAGYGAMHRSGVLAVAATNPTLFSTVVSLNLYDQDLSLLASVTSIATAQWSPFNTVAASRARFYAMVYNGDVSTSTIYAVSLDGVVVGSWVVPVPATHRSDGLAISNDDTIAYYTDQSGAYGIFRWDLVNNVALPSLIPLTDEIYTSLAITADGDILAMVFRADSGVDARQYGADGTLKRTWDLGLDAANGANPEFAYQPAADDGTFWVKTFPTIGAHTALFAHYRISDGALLDSHTVTLLDGGGVISSTCPFFVVPPPVCDIEPVTIACWAPSVPSVGCAGEAARPSTGCWGTQPVGPPSVEMEHP